MSQIAQAFASMVLREFERALGPDFTIIRSPPRQIAGGRRGQCLQALAHGMPMRTGRVAEVVGIGVQAASRCLRELHEAGYVRRVRRGWWQAKEPRNAA